MSNGAVHTAPADDHAPRRGLPDALRVSGRWLSASCPLPVLVIAACAGLAGAAVYLVAVSPAASRGDILISCGAGCVSAVGLGLYVFAKPSRELPMRLVFDAALLSILWLVLASLHPVAFRVGWLLAAMAVPLVAHEMLATVPGRADPRTRQVVLAGSLVVAFSWLFLSLTTRQPVLVAPLARCFTGCPHNGLFVGSSAGVAGSLARAGVGGGWLIVSLAVLTHLTARFRSAGSAQRRSIAPTLALAATYAAAVVACAVIGVAAPAVGVPVLWVLLVAATLLPLAMLSGLLWERLFLGGALAAVVNTLVDADPEDPRGLIAETLHEPTLQIGYPGTDAHYVDPSGSNVEVPDTGADWSVTAVPRHGHPDAVVIQQGPAPDEQRFIRAAGSAALIAIENHRLEHDLSASSLELADSRKRLVGAAYAERQRIERDLHDGVQQRLVGARVKLELADDALDVNPERGRRMLAEIGCDLDDALEEVRSLARGVYPALLETHGLVEALRSAARHSPGAVTVSGDAGRYRADTEAAIYFCCLETLQNVAKHAGRDASATVRIWEDGSALHFETRDSGTGFESTGKPRGQGLVNMRDRLAAVGGTLTLQSRAGFGTVVGGSVPIGEPCAGLG